MKPTKFIYFLLLSLLSLYGSVEFYKYYSESNRSEIQDIFLAPDAFQVEFSSVRMSNDMKIDFIVKKKVKTRVQDTQNRILKNIYHTNFLGFEILKDSVIFSVTSLYQLQQHTHLHLYQLF